LPAFSTAETWTKRGFIVTEIYTLTPAAFFLDGDHRFVAQHTHLPLLTASRRSPLMALPIPLSRGYYLALFGAGARSPDTAKALGIETLASCIGAVAAQPIGTPSVGETSEMVA
jgi:hypothetical protein